jgi:hypothetical protein
VLLHDVVVVQQPLAGGADVDGPVGRRGEPVVSVLENGTGAVQAGEERGASSGWPDDETLPGGQVLRALGQVLGAQQFPADRARQEVLPGGRAS